VFHLKNLLYEIFTTAWGVRYLVMATATLETETSEHRVQSSLVPKHTLSTIRLLLVFDGERDTLNF
jgi:hypothetical protein